MKTAVYYDRNDIRIEERARPRIEDDEVLVQMRACGVCGSDLMDWYIKPRAPLVLGHEPVGLVAERGQKVHDLDVGDRVFVHHHVACMTCHYCLRGDFTLCEQFRKTNIVPGGFSEYFKAPSPNLNMDTLKIPDNVSDNEAILIEPLGCCLRALHRCEIQIGDTVAVLGCGATGIMNVAVSKLFGASTVIASDFFKPRLRAAQEHGADLIVNVSDEQLGEIVQSVSDGRGVDVVVATAPNVDAYACGLGILRKGGRLCIFAPTDPEKSMSISPKELFFSERKIIPSYSTSHVETREALELIRNRRIDLRRLVTHRFTLDEISEAFSTAREDMTSLKVLVLNEG
jgi:L-iditol 2-dehydrogenase